MKKPYKFHELSDILCSNPPCGNRLKENVVARKADGKPLICWACWIMKTRGLTLAVYKKYRMARARAREAGGDPRAITTTA